MADPVNNRDVRKKEISKSFRGILRVSPDDEGADSGINETPIPVYDSVGNKSALSLGTDSIFVEKELVSETQLRDKIIFGTNSNVPVSPPQKEEVLLGDSSGNYIQYNLRQFLDEYFSANVILEQLVPVGTIIYTALGAEDLNRLPSKYQGWYDFCRGQSTNSQSGLTYNGTNYPDLCKVLTGSTSGSFTIPDLRNRYVRSASTISHYIGDEGGYTIPAHSAFSYENPQTNPYPSKVVIDSATGTFMASVYQGTASATGCFRIVSTWGGSGHRKYNGSSSYAVYGLDLAASVSQASTAPRETRPFSISLIPLIKIK